MRTIGPGMSVDTSGTFAKTITFSHWKGRSYGRLRVIPFNPKSTGQKSVRSALGTIAKACRLILTITKDTAVPAVGSQFFLDANATAPSGQSWISYLQKVLNANFATMVAAYGLLTGTVSGYYQAQAVLGGLASYTDKSGVAHTAGEQLYLLANFAVSYLSYTGFAAGVDEAAEAEVETFLEYCNTTV